MRSWILQPGTMATHSPAVRYAAVTILGALAIFAALLAMFYTTASDALGMFPPTHTFCKPSKGLSTLIIHSIPEAQIWVDPRKDPLRKGICTIR